MKQNNNCGQRDIFIHFRDMILYILLRWKSLLVMALVGAVVLTAFTYRRDVARYHSADQTPEKQETVEEVEIDADGMARIALVKNLQKVYNTLSTDNLNAPLMKVDAMAAPTQEMGYLVTGDNSFAAATVYRKYLENAALYEMLAEQNSTEEVLLTGAHFAELVTVTLERESDTAEGDNVFVHVKVVAPNKALLQELHQVIIAAMEEKGGEVRRTVGNHRGSWAYSYTGVEKQNALHALQLERLAAQEQALRDLADAEDKLTTAEEDYLFAHAREEEPEKPLPAPTVSVAAMLLGFFIGLGVMVAWWMLRYLSCGRVLSAAEMEVRHGLTTFGALAGDGKLFGLNRWLRKALQDKTVEPFLLWTRMALTAKNAGVQSVYLVGDADRLEGLAQVMEQQGVALQIGSSPLANADTLAAVAQAEGVILTADLELTRHATVAAELELVRQLGCQPLGALLIKK